jgi:dihydroxyacid dehydratase/phosphogluconate dehydratase
MLIVMIKLDHLDRLRLQRGVEHLHRLGPRATAEYLAEVARQIGGLPAMLGTLAEYERRLSPDLLRVVGGDRFPRRPLRVMSQ